MKITRESMKSFRGDFADAMEEISRKYGVNIELGNIKFNETSFEVKVRAKTVNETGTLIANSSDIRILNDEATRRNIPFSGNFLGSKYRISGKTFEIAGYEHRRYKFPVTARCIEDGKQYKFHFDQFKDRELV